MGIGWMSIRPAISRKRGIFLDRQERKSFFFEKKNQKTFINKCVRCRSVRAMDKSFCFFFQKETLSCFGHMHATR
jgi:hypothetical protein